MTTVNPSPLFTPAKRGDGIVVETRHQGYTIPEPGRTEPYDYHQYEVGVVTGITRDGRVRTWRAAWQDDDAKLALPFNMTQKWLLPASVVDVEACLQTYRDHHWPGKTEGLPKPYETLAEVTEAMRPHRKDATS